MAPEPGDYYIAVPASTSLGPLVVANSVSRDGVRSIVKIFDISLNLVSEPAFKGNVYHILLDGYRSEAYRYLSEVNPEGHQPGLVHYSNFRSNSGRTWSSTAELLGGSFYTPDLSPLEWRRKSISDGVLRTLADNGVRLHLYPHFPYFCQGTAEVCTPTGQVKKKVLREFGANSTIIDLWFLKLVPNSILHIFDEQADLSSGDYGFSIYDALFGSEKKPQPRDNPYFSVLQFKQMLEDEDTRPASGYYVFTHLWLPHGPYVLDGDCNYISPPVELIKNSEGGRDLLQTECADRLVSQLIAKLKSLGRLESSLIIVHSDHGQFWKVRRGQGKSPLVALDENVSAAEANMWTSERIENRSSALLLISGLSASDSLTSDLHVQMIDIAPTILRFFGIDVGDFPGIPIQDPTKYISRDQVFFGTKTSARATRRFLKYRYVDGKWCFEEHIQPSSLEQ